MNHELLHRLYHWSQPFPYLHQLSRHIILNIEVPLLRILLCPSNSQFIARNSIHSPADFNLLMSDIDFTVVTDKEENVIPLLRKRNNLKKLLPNIGESEIFLKEEWALKTHLESSPWHKWWTSVYLIRKLGWQRSSLAKAETSYDKAKIQRGIGITLRKLGHNDLPLNGSTLFPFLERAPKASNPYLTSSESLFLGAKIGLDPRKVDIHFQSVNELERFRLLLPDTLETPKVPADNEIKTYFMLHELLVATISLRLVSAHGDTERAKEIASWIHELHQRGCPTILMALE